MTSMPTLTLSYSQALLDLHRAGEIRCAGVEVGPFFSLAQVQKIVADLPDLPVEFHASFLGLTPFTRRPLEAYLKATRSRWISGHVRLLSDFELWLGLRRGIYLPLSRPKTARQACIAAVRRLQAWAPLPVILENMPCMPHPGLIFEGDPDLTAEILAETGCSLLLDLGHVRVAAGFFGISPVDYLKKLPLHTARQIHVSGPRLRSGYLYDAHESLSTEDYALLDWTLARTNAEVITLEYFRDRAALLDQTLKLQKMLA